MSYDIGSQAAYFSNSMHSRKRSLLGARGDFPTGLLYIVEKFLAKTPHVVKDARVEPTQPERRFYSKRSFTPYAEQKGAAAACLIEKRGIVVAPTGVGKSVIAEIIVELLQVNTLIVVPTLELKRQLTDSMKWTFGGVVGGLGSPIAVENVDALNPKTVLTGYGCVIIDEFHHSGAKTYRALNKTAWKNVFYRFGLTATPFRSQDNERLLLESVLSKVIYRITYQEAVDKGYIVPMEAYYVEVEPTKTEGYTWHEVYKDLVVDNKGRNAIVAEILDRLRDADRSTLCLVKEIQHGMNIGKAAEYTHAFAKGENDNNWELIRELEYANRKTLIGTTGVIGEGVDTKPCEYVIIAGLGKSKNAFMQQVGRGMRKYPRKESCKVIIFKDKSHKWTLAHYREQCKILREEYGIKPVRLEI